MAEPALQQHFYPMHSGPFTAQDRERMPEDGRELVPDITVAHTTDLGEKRITRTPLLVVEVISPSSRLMDPLIKRAKYEPAGVPAYWIADPVAPRLTVLELHKNSYVERAVLKAGDSVSLTQPFAVTVRL